jgi:hypothetical protein
MDSLPSLWPCADDQAVMATWFRDYQDLAYGMCYLFGTKRAAGMTADEAALLVRRMMESHLGASAC